MRLSPRFCLIVFVLSTTGCAHVQLRDSSIKQATTLTDIRYGQVLDNLAMSSTNPNIMPFAALVTDGSTNVQNNASSTLALNWDPYGLTSEMLGLTAGTTLAEQWGLSPIKEPERLHAMQCAYRWVLRGSGYDCGDCLQVLQHFKVVDELSSVSGECFHFGRRHDVPKDACYVGHYRKDAYVWVTADGVDALTRLSLVMLDIATVDLASLSPPDKTKTLEITYDAAGKQTGYKVTKIVADDAKLSADPANIPAVAPPQQKQRREFYPSGVRPSIILPRPQ
jgi:hypothetical protein